MAEEAESQLPGAEPVAGNIDPAAVALALVGAVRRGHFIGDINLAQNLQIHGMVCGTVTIAAGKQLHLHGKIEGDLIVEEGARVLIHGAVGGTIINHGAEVRIIGMAGSIQDFGNPKTYVNDQIVFEKSGTDMIASFRIELAALKAQHRRRHTRLPNVAKEHSTDVANIRAKTQKKAGWTSWITAD